MKECICKYKKHCHEYRQNSQNIYREITNTGIEECVFYMAVKRLIKKLEGINKKMYIEHELKTESKYFKAVCDGKKCFEVRKDDRDFKVGDYLKLIEYKDGRNQYAECSVKITYILGREDDEKIYVPDGYVILGIK